MKKSVMLQNGNLQDNSDPAHACKNQTQLSGISRIVQAWPTTATRQQTLIPNVNSTALLAGYRSVIPFHEFLRRCLSRTVQTMPRHFLGGGGGSFLCLGGSLFRAGRLFGGALGLGRCKAEHTSGPGEHPIVAHRQQT